MLVMSAHLHAMCWAAQGFPAPTTEHWLLGADSSPEPSQPYIPQQPAEDGGLIEFLTSTQVIFASVIGVMALVLLVFQVLAGRHEDRRDKEERKESG